MRTMLLVFVLFISACATQEQIAQRQAMEEAQRQQRAAAYWQAIRTRCVQMGYPADTPEFRNCQMQLHAIRQQQDAAILNAIAPAVIQQQRQQQTPAYRPIQPRTPTYTNCTRDYWGNVSCVTQ